MIIFRSITLLVLSLSLCNAEINSTVESEPHYIDKMHATLSKKVLEWSTYIDTKVHNWIDANEENSTVVEHHITTNDAREKQTKSVDDFFKNNKYFDETDNTFISIRFDSEFQSKESNDFHLKLGAQLPLSKSKTRFKLFLNDLTSDNAQNIIKDDDRASPDIGIHYFRPKKHGLESRYSLGLDGLYPYINARYFTSFKVGEWKIDPNQSFKYSTKDEFEEETNIYFDKKLGETSLFRLQLRRGSKDEIAGMDYALSLQYYWSPKKNTGFRLTQSFFGNTEYPCFTDNSVESVPTNTYGGIYNYDTSFTWRKNVWRKWFYYEVRPGINFHRDHDYKVNYSFRIFFDFYFGKYH